MKHSFKIVCIDIYSAANDPLPFLLDMTQTYLMAPTGDPFVDADSAAQSCRAKKQLSGETTNKYLIRMEAKIWILQKLALDVPSRRQQAMIYLFSLNPDNTYPVDLVSMCDLATNWCSESSCSRNHLTGNGNNSMADDKCPNKI